MKRLYSAPRFAFAAAALLCAAFAGGCDGGAATSAGGRNAPPANSPTAIVTNTNTAVAQVPSPVPAINAAPTAATDANVRVQPSPGGAAAAAGDDFAATRGLYAQNCAACHGAGGAGQRIGTVVYPSLKATALTDAQITSYITNGVPQKGMPAFRNRFTLQQIQGVVRYIREEFQGKK